MAAKRPCEFNQHVMRTQRCCLLPASEGMFLFLAASLGPHRRVYFPSQSCWMAPNRMFPLASSVRSSSMHLSRFAACKRWAGSRRQVSAPCATVCCQKATPPPPAGRTPLERRPIRRPECGLWWPKPWTGWCLGEKLFCMGCLSQTLSKAPNLASRLVCPICAFQISEGVSFV